MDNNIAASVMIRNKNNVWVDDNLVTECYSCKSIFYFLNRKHHCRNCGNIFCSTCTNQSIVIPTFITDKPDPEDFWNFSYHFSYLKGPEEKVCKQCYDIIQEKKHSYQKIMNILADPIPIEKIIELPQSDVDVKNHYFDHLRNTQYYLPNHKYTEIDKKILRVNAQYFSQHSKYLVHLIKSMDWNTDNMNNSNNFTCFEPIAKNSVNENFQVIRQVINNGKNKTCNDLYCTRTCQPQLSCDDCINILYSCANNLPDQLIQYLFNIIEKTPEQVILCHLLFFITLITNSTNETLEILLFKLLTRTKKMIYHTYWFLNNVKEKSTIKQMLNINKFINSLDRDLIKILDGEYIFFIGLINNLNNPKRYLLSMFDKYKPISLPYEPDKKLISFDLNQIEVKPSKTEPVVIPFITETGEIIKLLFKKESISNDVTVLNLMTLCDIILCENLNTDFGVVVYPTMPITLNSGMIQIVDKAETIYSITSKKKSILQHIVEKNEDRKVGDVLDMYTLSLVSYTLHSYFLALGDRHLQNIMITDNAAIFHIDFGYILGTDAYPLTSSDIKLNGNMLDVLGGYEGIRYKKYLELCSKGIILLRKYFNIFFILLSLDTNFKEIQIEKFVLARFQPRQRDDVVISELMSIIKQSNNAFSGYIKDFLHYHTQERTFQNGIGNIGSVLGSAYGVIKNFTINR